MSTVPLHTSAEEMAQRVYDALPWCTDAHASYVGGEGYVEVFLTLDEAAELLDALAGER